MCLCLSVSMCVVCVFSVRVPVRPSVTVCLCACVTGCAPFVLRGFLAGNTKNQTTGWDAIFQCPLLLLAPTLQEHEFLDVSKNLPKSSTLLGGIRESVCL